MATLHYWGIRARSYASLVVAKAGGVEVTANTNPDMAALKSSGALPFGQLPFLEHGDVKLAQSNAILRYFGKVGNLQGTNAAEFALSEMLIEEANDIFGIVNKAQYAPEKAKAYTEVFADPIPKQLAYLEKLLTGDFFVASARVTGEYALACTLDLLVALEPTVLDATPKLKKFYSTMLALPAFTPYKDWPMYLSRA